MRPSSVIAAALCCADAVFALTPAQWRNQSIYQVLTDRFARTDGSTTAACNTSAQAYCGGTWRGIINHLDYIQNMGFSAIWISPIVKNVAQNTIDGSSYHGYWAQDIYSLNSNFGTASDLVALSSALHSRGMFLMVDVVPNNMAYAGCESCVDYTTLNPFNSVSYYHPPCTIDYNNATSIKVCWQGDNIVALPDLRTENSNVQSAWNSWITTLVSNYSIDGLRIDSAQQISNGFFPSFQSAAGGIHVLGEVLNGDPNYVCPYQGYMTGLLNYPQFYWVTQAFQSTSGSISNLVNGISQMSSTCSDTTLLGSFTENHDMPRFASLTSDISLAKNAIAFTILSDGIPIMYAGQEQHDNGGGTPNNREATWLSGYNTNAVLYGWTATLNQMRNEAIYKDSSYLTYKAVVTYSDSSTVVLRKGNSGSQVVAVFSNQGASASNYILTLSTSQTGFTANQAIIEVTSCTAYTTDSNGNLAVSMSAGLPRVFYPKAPLVGSNICSSITCTPASSVVVTFNELVTTTYGQTIKVTGSIAALGNWSPSSAIALSASQYTANNPLWTVNVTLPAGTAFQYKFINVASSGAVTWEADPNHAFTVPTGCATAVTASSTWQS